MASSQAVKYLLRPNFAFTLFLIIMSLIFLSCNSGEEIISKGNDDDDDNNIDEDGLIRKMKMVLGSKPPQCVNKCLSCRPCMAILVIYQHNETPPHEHETSYYLLAWKCKCRNKLFQP